MDELPNRMAHGPVEFRLLAQVANDGDSVNDPTAVWPADRKLVSLGTISPNLIFCINRARYGSRRAP